MFSVLLRGVITQKMSSHRRSRKRRASSRLEDDSRSGREPDRFSFHRHKQNLNDILKRHGWIEDHEEFWKFSKKYESLRRPNGEEAGGGSRSDPRNLICFKLKFNLREIASGEIESEKMNEFLTIVLAYLNFKQFEKFKRVKKIRQSQKELPVANYEDRIVEILRGERVAIVAGDTGCGKSTQIPQYLMRNGFGRIVCTQPRRLACVSLCSRLKYETLTQNKNEIGYQVRFEKAGNRESKIVFVTEGLLARQMISDSHLTCYDVVILDEVHERHIQSDFVLGLLKCLLLKRKDLRVVLMSATINAQLFRDYFGENAEILRIPGRLFPVRVVYRPPEAIGDAESTKKRSKIDPTPYLQIMQIIDEKYRSEKGDLLIFVSGISEITCLAEAVNEYRKKSPNWIVLMLHSSLPLADQDKVFDYAPDGYRKCVISTNIAETSITIDRIRFVVDSGKAKEMIYDTVYRIQRLKEFWISRSSAEQRKGRAGRTGPGICYRIYSEEEYAGFEEFSLPEIKKSPLDSVLLQMIEMGLPDVRKFPFLEEPDPKDLENSILGLKQQRALTDDERITEIGRTLARLPVEIPIGKMLIVGSAFGRPETTIVLSSALSVPTPYANNAFRNFDLENSRRESESDHGDPITLINLYREWLIAKREKEDSRRWCRRRGLEEQRFYEMTKLNRQFEEILTETGLTEGKEESETVTSQERMIRNGEVRLLKRLRAADRARDPIRKRLKPEAYEFENDSEKPEMDVRDIEFRLRNDAGKVRELLRGINVTSRRDLTVLKMVFCSGLYPRFAIPDEFNGCRTDQLFHTKAKSHVSLHPFSYFGLHPEALKTEDQDVVVPPRTGINYSSKIFSSRHEILCYFNLLETAKVYLTNMIRMPALQTLLLFSRTIDSSYNFSKLIFDNWILIEVLNPRQSETLVLRLIDLRKRWNSLVTDRLSKRKPDKGEADSVTDDLISFLNSDLAYGLKRLIPADLKHLYLGPEIDFVLEENYFDGDFVPRKNAVKGGIWVTEFLTYNCLRPSEGEDFRASDPFRCRKCENSFRFDCLERIGHVKTCGRGEGGEREGEGDSGEDRKMAAGRKPNSIEFDCVVCNRKYFLTKIEILKHRKRCASESDGRVKGQS